MNPTIWTIIGIFITLATFGIVFWRTTSARKERERHAHKDIVVTLARLLAQEQTGLQLSVIEAMLKSKSREYNVNLLSDELPMIIDDLVTKFSESEFINTDVRKSLIDKSFQLRAEFEQRKPKLEDVTDEVKEPERSYQTSRRNIWLSLSGAGISALITYIILSVIFDTTEYLTSYVYVIGGIIFILAVVSFGLSYGAMRKRRETGSSILNKVLEDMVFDILIDKAPPRSITRRVRSSAGGDVAEVDFIVNLRNDERIPIDVKSGSISDEAIKSMAVAMKGMLANRGIIITATNVPNDIRKAANENNILIVEGITSEAELINNMKEIEF